MFFPTINSVLTIVADSLHVDKLRQAFYNQTMTDQDMLTRRVAKVLPDRDSLAKLMQSRKIRLYQGFDPTGIRLHLGHTIGLRKLMEFARAGHEVIFLFGTGTVLVGDPSLRDTARKLISQEEIEENIKGWKKQVEPIVDFDLITIKQNGDWLPQMTLRDIVKVASNLTAIQLFKRDSFTRRIERGDTVWYHETMYPMLQGYDSVVMDVDLEIGGTDQEFNMLVGRELQRKMNNREKYVLTVPMILGTDGKTMSKTSGNCIYLNESPEDMFTKLMAVRDELVPSYYELLTDFSLEEVSLLDMSDPIAVKKRLAFDITRQLHGDTGAKQGQKHFESVVQAKGIDENLPPLNSGPTVFETLKNADLDLSNSEIKRTIEQGGVEINGRKVTDPNAPVTGSTIKFGKKIRRRLK